MKYALFVITFILTHVTFAWGTKYYVNPVGSTFNDGLSASKPKKDFQSIANSTVAGDTVFFMNGNYSNSCAQCDVLEIKSSGKAGAYIVFMNYPGHHPKIKFNGWQGIAIVNGASYIKIIGFEIEGNSKNVTISEALTQPGTCNNLSNPSIDPRFNGNGIGVKTNNNQYSHHLVFSGNIVHECGGGGIGINQSDYITIEDNVVYNNCWYSIYGTSGISLYQSWNLDTFSGYKNIIRRNKCFNNINFIPVPSFGCVIQDGNGIIIDDSRNTQNQSNLGAYKGKTLIENNIVWYNGGSGIHTFLSENIDIINNTAYLNNQSPAINCGQILANSSNNINILNNILYAPTGKMINNSYNSKNIQYYNNLHYNGSIAILNNLSCINKDPLFIRAIKSLNANFHTYGSSSTIDAGTTLLYSQSDIELVKRPIGKLPDIGAYETATISLKSTSNTSTSKQVNHITDKSSAIDNEALYLSVEYPKLKNLEGFDLYNDEFASNISLSPNPAKSYVNVKFTLIKGQNANLSIFNLYGVPINIINVVGNGDTQSEIFIIEGLKEGKYFVVLANNKKIISKPLLISNSF
ncbi:choice-of-anchor Q domain-containing protein [Spirosoma pollinicola]|nr:choice-of-anchor Q domain-containing protein [Spirosoma pollinicola]